MSIKELVAKYEKNREYYLSEKYNETLLRSDFLDVFFELLGWDIKNNKGQSTFEREVLLEENLKTENSPTKKPDYTFRLYNERKFFLEAKKPSVKIEALSEPACQLRRYGFTAKLKVSVLSNFEYLIIYDCSQKVSESDTTATRLVKKYHYSQYEEYFEEIKSLIGKDSVYNGTFDNTWKDIESQLELYSIDTLFLEQINHWRLILGQAIYNLKSSIDEIELNDVVQAYINSIIFLRVCEDRNIEDYHSLLKIKNDENYDLLVQKFKLADSYYNSGLFELPYVNEIVSNISSVFWDIISDLYFPNSVYSFSVLSSDILGNIYEIMLQDKLYLRSGQIELDRKPENVDRDVVTTPNFIIKEIIEKTLKSYLLEGIKEPFDVKIADIACGSGAFLLEAFQFLNDYVIDLYKESNKEKLIPIGVDSFKLDFETKKKILTNCIYGIDKDYNAVATTKFGLLLKLLENETIETLPDKGILPILDNNISWGNSLISNEELSTANSELKETINPFDFGNLKFDIIVGNPPYMKTEDIANITPLEKPLYEQHYQSAFKQYDKYFLFVERSLNLLNKNGIFGYILPSKFTKVGSGIELRKLLKEKLSIKEIISFGANQIFSDKTTYTNILILTQKPNEIFNYTEINDLKSWILKTSSPVNMDNKFNISDLDDDVWILYPEQYKTIYKKIIANTKTLKEFVGIKNIFNGIQTSRNDYFVINPINEDDEYIYFEKDGNEWAVEQNIVRPYYETPDSASDDSLNTYRKFKPNCYVIYPYELNNEKIEHIKIDNLETAYPKCYEYLTKNKDKFIHSKKGGMRDIKPKPTTNEEWYRYGRSQALAIGDIPEKIIVGILSQGNKYAIDEHKTLISSGGTAGYCMITLPVGSEYSVYYLQAILNSKFIEWITSLNGEIFRGGYIARGTKVLAKLPIKTIDFSNAKEKQIHDNIVELQKKLITLYESLDEHKENHRKLLMLNDEFSKTKQLLDNKLFSLYGIEEDDVNQLPNIKEYYAIN